MPPFNTHAPQHKPTGFTGLAPGWCMLDPIKVAIVSPGMTPDGTLLVRSFFGFSVCHLGGVYNRPSHLTTTRGPNRPKPHTHEYPTAQRHPRRRRLRLPGGAGHHRGAHHGLHGMYFMVYIHANVCRCPPVVTSDERTDHVMYMCMLTNKQTANKNQHRSSFCSPSASPRASGARSSRPSSPSAPITSGAHICRCSRPIDCRLTASHRTYVNPIPRPPPSPQNNNAAHTHTHKHSNESLSRVLPSLYEAYRESYRGKGLRDLCDEMFAFKARARQVCTWDGGVVRGWALDVCACLCMFVGAV